MKRRFLLLLALTALAPLASQASAQSGPRGPMPQQQRQMRAANGALPGVNPNLSQGNVRNPLLGNGSGLNPRLASNTTPPVAAAQAAPAQAAVAVAPVKGKADCRHVIDLLVHHCVGNRRIEPCAKHLLPDFRFLPPLLAAHHGAIGPFGFAAPAIGDLELIEIGMLSDATEAAGPLYQVTIKNTGAHDAEHFRVSIVAVLGAIAEDSPSVTINVDRIGAGETATLQVQLPVAVMALTAEGAQPAAFDSMVVAIDSFDELVEDSELNNVSVLKRAEVHVVQVGVAAAAQPGAPAAQAPAAAEAPATQEVAPPPQDSASPKSTENIDLDSLDLSEAEGTRELFTR